MFKNNFNFDYGMRVRERLRLQRESEKPYNEVDRYVFSESGCLFHDSTELASFTDINDDLNNDHYEDIDFFTMNNAV